MPNNLAAVTPRILAQGLKVLRENAKMAMLVNRNYDTLAARRGSTIDVPISSSMGIAEDVVPSVVGPTPPDITPNFVPIRLDRWKKKDFQMSDRDIQEVMDGYVNLQVEEAAKSLANQVDRDLLSLYREIYGVAGVAGNTPFQPFPPANIPNAFQDLNPAKDARRILNRQLCPDDALRRIVLDVEAEANASALTSFMRADAAGTDETIRYGRIGTKMGFDWYMNQNVPRHTPTGVVTTPVVNGAQLAGATTLTVAGFTTAPGIGDTFTIAGLNQTFVVRAAATTTSIPISPPLPANVASGTAITYSTTAQVCNLAFHRDAFALVIRPLEDIEPLGNQIEVMTDDVSGITMRLELSRGNKMTIFSFDILYGVGVLRPELACRILG